MKVTGSNGVGSAQVARGAARAPGGFSIGGGAQASSPAATARVSAAMPVAGLDALIALQAVGGPLERRRRAVSRAGRILDMLEDVKVALLDGEVTPATLDRLMGAVREQREQTDDAGLEGVLNEIETRAAVELAKLGMAA